MTPMKSKLDRSLVALGAGLTIVVVVVVVLVSQSSTPLPPKLPAKSVSAPALAPIPLVTAPPVPPPAPGTTATVPVPPVPDPPLGLNIPVSSRASKSTYQRKLPTVFPGSKAEFPGVKSWLNGTPLPVYQPGTIYFIELFSTTCGHCEEAAPEVDEMVRVYKPQGVQFMAISKEEPEKISTWLAKPEIQARIKFPIGSDPDHWADRTLQAGTFKNLTPRVFLIKDSIIQWFGHPTDAKDPLAQLVAGTWDPSKVEAEFKLNSQVEQAKARITSTILQAEKSSDWGPTLKLIDSITDAFPEREASFKSQRFAVMIGVANMPVEGYALGKKIAAENATDLETLRILSRTTLNSQYAQVRDLDFAMELALAADALGNGENPKAAEVVAFAYFSKGDREKAIEHIERAIRLQTEDALLKLYGERLTKYQTTEPGPVPYNPPTKPGAPVTVPPSSPAGSSDLEVPAPPASIQDDSTPPATTPAVVPQTPASQTP